MDTINYQGSFKAEASDSFRPCNPEKVSALLKPESSWAQDFVQSAVYAGLQNPVTGTTQLIDKCIGSNLARQTQFMKEPVQADPFSLRWHAQTLDFTSPPSRIEGANYPKQSLKVSEPNLNPVPGGEAHAPFLLNQQQVMKLVGTATSEQLKPPTQPKIVHRDTPAPIVPEGMIVITGGPSVGKSTVLNLLRAEGFPVMEEIAGRVISEGEFHPLKNREAFQRKVMTEQIASERSLDGLGVLRQASTRQIFAYPSP